MNHYNMRRYNSYNAQRAGVVIMANNYILLIQQQNGNISIPKGKRFKNETVRQCMERELYEETGIRLDDYPRHDFAQSNSFNRYQVFYINIHKSHLEIPTCIHDICEVKRLFWFPVAPDWASWMSSIQTILGIQEFNFNLVTKLTMIRVYNIIQQTAYTKPRCINNYGFPRHNEMKINQVETWRSSSSKEEEGPDSATNGNESGPPDDKDAKDVK